jgi:hypothetical protein
MRVRSPLANLTDSETAALRKAIAPEFLDQEKLPPVILDDVIALLLTP